MSLRPVVISGPSGSGKSTLLKMLLKNFKNAFGFSVSHTSRAPRAGEKNGVDYYFSSRESMTREIERGNFVEHAEFSGNLYGTSREAITKVMGRDLICVLDLEEQGVRSMKETDINALYVFIKPPSLESLRERLQGRGTETADSIERRMDTALSSMQFSEIPGVFDIVIINDRVKKAYQELESFLTREIPRLEDFRVDLVAS